MGQASSKQDIENESLNVRQRLEYSFLSRRVEVGEARLRPDRRPDRHPVRRASASHAQEENPGGGGTSAYITLSSRVRLRNTRVPCFRRSDRPTLVRCRRRTLERLPIAACRD
jgi:hypothetical protein